MSLKVYCHSLEGQWPQPAGRQQRDASQALLEVGGRNHEHASYVRSLLWHLARNSSALDRRGVIIGALLVQSAVAGHISSSNISNENDAQCHVEIVRKVANAMGGPAMLAHC